MTHTRKRNAIVACGSILLVLFLSTPLLADPCLVVYPSGICEYHYDTSEYYTVGPGHPLYDPMYDRGGEVLLEVGTDEVDLSIYQAPGLASFQPSIGGQEGYFILGNDYDLIVDGFSNSPTTYEDILLVFVADPGDCSPIITVDGNPVLSDPGLGLYYPIGDLVVSTPTPEGSNYSDTVTHSIHWGLCYGVRVWAFADEDHNKVHDGGECFTAFSHDVTVPVQETTWGHIKSLYND
jgi:hypothetical protein